MRLGIDEPKRNALKIISMCAVLALAPWAWIPTMLWKTTQLHAFGYSLDVLIKFIAACILGVAGTIIVPLLRNPWLRVPVGLLMVAGFVTNFTLALILGTQPSIQIFQTLFQAAQHASPLEAAMSYSAQTLAGAAVAALILPAFLLQPSQRMALEWWAIVVPLIATGLTFHLLSRYPGKMEEMPSTIATAIQAYKGMDEARIYLPPRNAIAYNGQINAQIKKVVLIVDESVRGDYLQINNPSLDNTPFLESKADELANFGVAVANTNCSALARLALRSGVRDTDYPDPNQAVLKQPTFWQYAKAANYKTIYLDAWQPLISMASLLSVHELTYIDERVNVDLSRYWNADNMVAARLNELLAQPGKAFIFVEKIGLHAPYEKALAGAPPSSYSPKLPISTQALSSEDREAVATYSKGIKLRVDDFFATTWQSINQPNVLAIYTSDHGQSLYEGGYAATHCSGKNTIKAEAFVPIFLTTGNKDVRAKFREAAARGKDAANHNDIFPTLLWALGFDTKRVAPEYPAGLQDVPKDRVRRFHVGSPFRDQMDWITVD